MTLFVSSLGTVVTILRTFARPFLARRSALVQLLATLSVVLMDLIVWGLLPTASVMLSAEIMETAVLILLQLVPSLLVSFSWFYCSFY